MITRVSPSGHGASVARRCVAVCAGLSLTFAATASAQSPPDPVDGGTNLVGTVDSMLELILTQPVGFSSFPAKKTYTTSFQAMVTTSDDAGARLSIVDGDATSTKQLGHLASGSKLLPQPLQARVGTKGSFVTLDQTIDPQLASWTQPISRQAAAIGLRQKVTSKAAGTYRKILLVSVSPETP
jgi:hypothetical protein